MKIKVLEYPINEGSGILNTVKFRITQLEDEEILKISQLSPISINFNPRACDITNFSWRPPVLSSKMNWTFIFKTDKNGILNFDELGNIELMFPEISDADKFKAYILDQFKTEIDRIKKISNTINKVDVYEIKAEEGIKKIYEGAEKVLDKNSIEYKEIVERNREAWKKLADL
jgi:hypothetical protein